MTVGKEIVEAKDERVVSEEQAGNAANQPWPVDGHNLKVERCRYAAGGRSRTTGRGGGISERVRGRMSFTFFVARGLYDAALVQHIPKETIGSRLSILWYLNDLL